MFLSLRLWLRRSHKSSISLFSPLRSSERSDVRNVLRRTQNAFKSGKRKKFGVRALPSDLASGWEPRASQSRLLFKSDVKISTFLFHYILNGVLNQPNRVIDYFHFISYCGTMLFPGPVHQSSNFWNWICIWTCICIWIWNAQKVQQGISVELFVHFDILWNGDWNQNSSSIAIFFTGSLDMSKIWRICKMQVQFRKFDD